MEEMLVTNWSTIVRQAIHCSAHKQDNVKQLEIGMGQVQPVTVSLG